MKTINEKALFPQLMPSTHPSFFSLAQSYMTLFQSSPVDNANSSTKEFMKFLKFLCTGSITSPSVI